MPQTAVTVHPAITIIEPQTSAALGALLGPTQEVQEINQVVLYGVEYLHDMIIHNRAGSVNLKIANHLAALRASFFIATLHYSGQTPWSQSLPS